VPEVPELRGARGKRPALLHGECDGAPSLSVGPGVGTSRERAPCAGQLIGRPARAASSQWRGEGGLTSLCRVRVTADQSGCHIWS